MAYLGTLGRLVELRGINSQQVEAEDRYTFQTTLEGRTKAQVRPIGRRKWDLGTKDTTRAEDLAAIMSFANGAWGPGPFVFVSADAPVTNLLSPGVASCDPSEKWGVVTVGAPMRVEGAWTGRSYVANGSPNIFFGTQAAGAAVPGERVPVIPGDTVTGSVYLLGAGAYCRVAFYNSADVLISQVNSTVAGSAAAPVRSWVSAVVPAGAVSCRVLAIGATQAARPSVTWTDALFPWADGQGCPKAVMHGASRSLVLASRDLRGGRYSNIGFTVTEVG